MKTVRSKKQKKSIEEVLKERTDNRYGPGVGLTAGLTAKCKAPAMTGSEQKKKQNKAPCCSTVSKLVVQRPAKTVPLRSKVSDADKVPAW